MVTRILDEDGNWTDGEGNLINNNPERKKPEHPAMDDEFRYREPPMPSIIPAIPDKQPPPVPYGGIVEIDEGMPDKGHDDTPKPVLH